MKILTCFNFFFRNYFNDAASNLQWVHERYNWCVNLRNVGFFNGSCVRRILCGCREIARSEFGTIRFAPCTQLHHCCEGEERHVRWPDAEVFACLLTKNSANASDTDSSGRLFATPALRDDAMVEVNVERENPWSHNSRSRNSIGTSTVSLCATYQSRSRLRYKLSFKTLHLSSLSRFLSTCMSFAPAPITEFYPQYTRGSDMRFVHCS